MSKKYLTIAGGTILALIIVVFWARFGMQNNTNVLTPTGHVEVILTEKGFVPESVYLKLNGTVIFKTQRDKPFWPASNLHPTHGIYPEFDPRHALSPSDSWTFQFDKVGEWKYHDHLRSYFTGIIYVVE